MDHIGIDVHKMESQLCILSEDGQLSELRIRTTPERFAAVLGDRPPPESEWVARCLDGLGHEVIVADRTSSPCTRPAVARSRRIDAMLGRWPRPVGWGPTGPPIGSPMPSAMCAGA